jgi:adenosylcobinamide kinase/adenosylcobinamide-phosphate guanylyltransferase
LGDFPRCPLRRGIDFRAGFTGPGAENLEEPVDLVGALRREAAPARILLVDCLTLWLTNVMLGGLDVEAACSGLADAIPGLAGPAVLVSNEVGWGIVPDNRLARDFRDAQGRLNQRMAESCGRVVLVAAGLPLTLKGTPA